MAKHHPETDALVDVDALIAREVLRRESIGRANGGLVGVYSQGTLQAVIGTDPNVRPLIFDNDYDDAALPEALPDSPWCY